MKAVRIKKKARDTSGHAAERIPPEGDAWEYPAAPAALSLAADNAASDPNGSRLSLLYAIARLHSEGLQSSEIGTVLNMASSVVRGAMHDARYDLVERRVMLDKGLQNAISSAQARYRVERAYEVLTGELDSKSEWIRHGAAMAIIAADKADKGQGGGQVQIILSSDMDFDDQSDLQDTVPDDAKAGDLTMFDAQFADSDDSDQQNEP